MHVDIEKLLVGFLHTHLAVKVVTDLPANLQDVLPVVQVVRFGGADRQVVLDSPNVDVEVYAADRAAARLLAEQVRSALLFDLPGTVVDEAVVSSASTISAPSWRPYDDTGLRRFGATYQFTTHSRKATP